MTDHPKTPGHAVQEEIFRQWKTNSNHNFDLIAQAAIQASGLLEALEQAKSDLNASFVTMRAYDLSTADVAREGIDRIQATLTKLKDQSDG